MLAKIVNDDAFQQDKRGVHESIASKLAPTGVVFSDEQDARLAALPHLGSEHLMRSPPYSGFVALASRLLILRQCLTHERPRCPGGGVE